MYQVLTKDVMKLEIVPYLPEIKRRFKSSFRTLLNRSDTTVTSWKRFDFMDFIVISLNKFYKFKKSSQVNLMSILR